MLKFWVKSMFQQKYKLAQLINLDVILHLNSFDFRIHWKKIKVNSSFI